jgi:hypothetical protein
MDTVKIYLRFFAFVYRTSSNVYQNEKCFNTHRTGNKIHFLYVKLLDNIRRKQASECLPQETLAFPVVKIYQTQRKNSL